METGKTVPIYRARLPRLHNLIPAIHSIDRSQNYSNNGPLKRRLELQIAHRLGISESCVALVSNATLALQGAAVTMQESEEPWLMPSWTFAATAQAIALTRASIVFGDIQSDWRLNLDNFKTSNCTFRILDVVPFGDRIIPERYEHIESPVLIDAAVSLGNLIEKNIEIPARSGIIFSLHATKPISSGEGGIFVSLDKDWVDRFRRWSIFGFGEGRSAEVVGTNAKFSEYAAAVGLASLNAWDRTRKELIRISKWARRLSNELGLGIQPSLRDNTFAPYWIVEMPNAEAKTSLVYHLKETGIESRDWWGNGCHRMPAFQNASIHQNLSKTEEIASRTIGLPFFIDLQKSEMKRIEKALKSWNA